MNKEKDRWDEEAEKLLPCQRPDDPCQLSKHESRQCHECFRRPAVAAKLWGMAKEINLLRTENEKLKAEIIEMHRLVAVPNFMSGPYSGETCAVKAIEKLSRQLQAELVVKDKQIVQLLDTNDSHVVKIETLRQQLKAEAERVTERDAQILLEARYERGTSWDLALTWSAINIRAAQQKESELNNG